MTQAIEDNTKAINRLTNTLLSIFEVTPGVGDVATVAPAGKPAGAPQAAKAGAGTGNATKPAPAGSGEAPKGAEIPMVRESASRLTLHMASSTAEGQGKQAAVDLLAEYNDADGNPCKGAKALTEADVPAYLKRIIGIIGEAQARTVLGIK